MFTGIVQGTAEVIEVSDLVGLRQLALRFPPGALEGVRRGASIALDGVCLTVTTFDEASASFDCMDETLALTTLGGVSVGGRLNFERAARVGDEIGGHVVSGHVLGTAEVVARRERENNLELVLAAPEEALSAILPKGFVAIDGISLTVGRIEAGNFSVHLIPETLVVTTLGGKQVGDRCNLELDSMTQAVVATVERVLAARSAG